MQGVVGFLITGYCKFTKKSFSEKFLAERQVSQFDAWSVDPCAPIGYGKKGKVFPYSLPSVGPGADPGEQAVSPQVT